MYVPDYRFSEDLDFTLLDTQRTNADLQAAVEGLFPWFAREANITLVVCRVEEHNSGTLLLRKPSCTATRLTFFGRWFGPNS